ncbi:uncharacterized protein LOC110436674 isoform X2 [Sorghum bicolor]|nr:uncharacterized protein LOC110436674 isoform X2 [Sorghum bicolor]|eukprot:XP_021319807.1 uncharacterized protein LOC110436674 isoform X2 [Sorghum bicolor]
MLLPCQLTTTASLRVLLQHCWQDPGCVPCKCSIVGAGHGQELLFNCSKQRECLKGKWSALLHASLEYLFQQHSVVLIRGARNKQKDSSTGVWNWCPLAYTSMALK